MQATLSVPEVAHIAQAKKPAFRVPWRHALMRWAPLYSTAVEGCRMADPCMLAAIVARESGGANVLQYGMELGPGCGVGLCQITAGVDWSTGAPRWTDGTELMNPATNLRVAAHNFLEPALERFAGNHVAAFAAYNLGGGGVQREIDLGIDVDTWTTGHDYGHAVFTDFINFVAASIGVNVDWVAWKG